MSHNLHNCLIITCNIYYTRLFLDIKISKSARINKHPEGLPYKVMIVRKVRSCCHILKDGLPEYILFLSRSDVESI